MADDTYDPFDDEPFIAAESGDEYEDDIDLIGDDDDEEDISCPCDICNP